MDTFYYKLLLTLILFLGTLLNYAQPVETEKLTYPQLQEQFKNLSKGPVKGANVNNIEFQKEGAVFVLTKGTLYQCPPINGEVHAMLFLGEGNFSLTPPGEIEQMQLFRFHNKKTLNQSFNFIFLFFTDSTYNELNRSLSFTDTEVTREYTSHIKDAMKYLLDKDEEYLHDKIIYTLLEGKTKNFFYAQFKDDQNKPMFFEIDPSSVEDVHLMERYDRNFRDWHEMISQYPSDSKRTFGELNDKLVDGSVKVSKYEIKSNIKDNMDFSADVKLTFTPGINNQACILFNLYYNLEIDSIFWNGNKYAEYYKEEESSSLWIIPYEPLKEGEIYSLNIYYHGDLLEKNDLGWIALRSSITWFPNCLDNQKSIFDLTFSYPDNYKLCSVGENTSNITEDNVIISRWETRVPIRNASFNLGRYNEHRVENANLPPVTVYMSAYGHNQIAQRRAAMGGLTSRNMDEKIASDVINCFNLFKETYGNVSAKEIFVTESPYFHSEAFPGMVHLSWLAFQGINIEGEAEKLIAHEVAHQWWGIGVDFESYHDQWLSEAFAEYSGLWYMQLTKGNKVFFDFLDRWKTHIMDNRQYLFDSGQEAGPVWLGYRTSSSSRPGGYNLIIYKKGAWILHMLRSMLLDLKTMNEDKFQNMMKDFFTSFKDKKANTKDFQKIVEKHIGENMDWFFNQWVYGTSVPEYKFAYKTEQTPDGKFKVRCRVKQENVPDNFKAYVNLLLKFDEDRFARVRAEVINNIHEFDLPLLPIEPTEIIFNDLNSVLCDVENEDW